MKHELKILPAYFEAVLSGEKTFEIRNNNDRGFQKGDTLVLREFDPDLSSSTLAMCYTGRTIERVVSYVSNYEQQPGFVVLGLKQQRLPEGWKARQMSSGEVIVWKDGLGSHRAEADPNNIPSLILHALASDLLAAEPKPEGGAA